MRKQRTWCKTRFRSLSLLILQGKPIWTWKRASGCPKERLASSVVVVAVVVEVVERYLVHGQAFNIALGFRIAKDLNFSYLIVVTSVVDEFDSTIGWKELVEVERATTTITKKQQEVGGHTSQQWVASAVGLGGQFSGSTLKSAHHQEQSWNVQQAKRSLPGGDDKKDGHSTIEREMTVLSGARHGGHDRLLRRALKLRLFQISSAYPSLQHP